MLFVIIQNAVIDEINTKMKFSLIKFKRIVFLGEIGEWNFLLIKVALMTFLQLFMKKFKPDTFEICSFSK
jgi:hypothetical protein